MLSADGTLSTDGMLSADGTLSTDGALATGAAHGPHGIGSAAPKRLINSLVSALIG
jgi:hypothetical protein